MREDIIGRHALSPRSPPSSLLSSSWRMASKKFPRISNPSIHISTRRKLPVVKASQSTHQPKTLSNSKKDDKIANFRSEMNLLADLVKKQVFDRDDIRNCIDLMCQDDPELRDLSSEIEIDLFRQAESSESDLKRRFRKVKTVPTYGRLTPIPEVDSERISPCKQRRVFRISPRAPLSERKGGRLDLKYPVVNLNLAKTLRPLKRRSTDPMSRTVGHKKTGPRKLFKDLGNRSSGGMTCREMRNVGSHETILKRSHS